LAFHVWPKWVWGGEFFILFGLEAREIGRFKLGGFWAWGPRREVFFEARPHLGGGPDFLPQGRGFPGGRLWEVSLFFGTHWGF